MPRASGDGASFRTFEPLARGSAIRVMAALLIALLFGGAPQAYAQGGLYGPEAPRDVSYLRVINARPGEAVVPVVAGEEWRPLEHGSVSAYRQLPPGEHAVNVGGIDLTVATRPEGFVTLALLEDELVAIEDTPLRDISRGLLTLYNLTADRTLTLATADGTEVIREVAPRAAASRSISEAEVALVVTASGEPLAELESRLYRRGEAHGVIVLPTGANPQLIYVTAAAEH